MLFPGDTNENNANSVEQQFSAMSVDGAIDWDNLIGITSNHPARQMSSSTDEEEYEDTVIEIANNNKISSLLNLR